MIGIKRVDKEFSNVEGFFLKKHAQQNNLIAMVIRETSNAKFHRPWLKPKNTAF